jgi:cell division transport system ATP-binding protein
VIRFEKVSKIYNNSLTALDQIDLTIEPKEFVSIVGPSGAGKTTLIKLLIREEYPTKGKIFIGSQEISSLPEKDLPYLRRKIGVMFQDFKLLPEKTAYENIAFAMEMSGLPSRQIANDVPQALKLVGLLDKADHFPRQLSGGEQQRIALARSLIHRPEILVADEPTGNLDPANAEIIIRLLVQINLLGTIVILASHDPRIISQLNHRFVSLNSGRVVKDGTDYIL